MLIMEVFGHFLKKFLIQYHETWFTGMLWALSGVCENGLCGQNFRALFGPKWGQNRSIYRFSSIFLKRFHWIHPKLDL